VAQHALALLNRQDTPEMRELITNMSLAQGHWSVWMSVFSSDADMLARFVDAFPGTCAACFDAECRSVPRPGGRL